MFINFEGGDGSGKSTQSSILTNRIKQEGFKVILIQEPGSTQLGNYLRTWLKQEDTTPLAELFLFEAARAELIHKIISPALKNSTIIICDRFSDSTLAYQGFGRGIPLLDIIQLNQIATQGIVADLTFLLDCNPIKSLNRTQQINTADNESSRRGKEGERFEKETIEFHTRIREGYLKLAAKDPKRWRIINGEKPIPSISKEIWTQTKKILTSKILAPRESGSTYPN